MHPVIARLSAASPRGCSPRLRHDMAVDELTLFPTANVRIGQGEDVDCSPLYRFRLGFG